MTGRILAFLMIALSATLLSISFFAPPPDPPEYGNVTSSCEFYLGLSGMEVQEYIGHGSGNDGIWWARIRVSGVALTPELIEAQLKSHLRRKPAVGSSFVRIGPAEFRALDCKPPGWWSIHSDVYGVSGPSSGFFITRANRTATPEWNLMSYHGTAAPAFSRNRN